MVIKTSAREGPAPGEQQPIVWPVHCPDETSQGVPTVDFLLKMRLGQTEYLEKGLLALPPRCVLALAPLGSVWVHHISGRADLSLHSSEKDTPHPGLSMQELLLLSARVTENHFLPVQASPASTKLGHSGVQGTSRCGARNVGGSHEGERNRVTFPDTNWIFDKMSELGSLMLWAWKTVNVTFQEAERNLSPMWPLSSG